MKNKVLVCICAACGVGKSTVNDYFNDNKLLDDFVALDTDDVGLNWWDYADTENPDQFTIDSLKIAVELAKDKNLIFLSCLNPIKFYDVIDIPDAITSTYMIALTCSSEEIRNRLKMRDPERMCGDDEFIDAQIHYNNWFLKNTGKFQLSINNSKQTVEETALKIVDFIKCVPK